METITIKSIVVYFKSRHVGQSRERCRHRSYKIVVVQANIDQCTDICEFSWDPALEILAIEIQGEQSGDIAK